jgi:hypothetical protein
MPNDKTLLDSVVSTVSPLMALVALVLSIISFFSSRQTHHADVILQSWFQLLGIASEALPPADAESFRVGDWKTKCQDVIKAIPSHELDNIGNRDAFVSYLSTKILSKWKDIPQNEYFRRTDWIVALDRLRNSASAQQKPILDQTLRSFLSDDQKALIDVQSLIWPNTYKDVFPFLCETHVFGPALNDPISDKIAERFNSLPSSTTKP